MSEYLKFSDLFEINCKKCGSNDVNTYVDHCEECGDSINAECNVCGSKYDYHEFERSRS